MPRIMGISKSVVMVCKSFQKSRLTSVSIIEVGGYKLPQKARFRGVMKIARELDTAVKLTESAVFPLAMAVMKLEIFPPGQAATSIIPKAKLGLG